MAKLISPVKSAGWQKIAKNSLSVSFGDPVAVKSGFLDKAVAWDTIIGYSTETKTFASDNQTVAKAQLQYVAISDEFIAEYTVANGTIAQANVWAKYNLNASSNVDWATAGTWTQLVLDKVINSTLWWFKKVD